MNIRILLLWYFARGFANIIISLNEFVESYILSIIFSSKKNNLWIMSFLLLVYYHPSGMDCMLKPELNTRQKGKQNRYTYLVHDIEWSEYRCELFAIKIGTVGGGIAQVVSRPPFNLGTQVQITVDKCINEMWRDCQL